MLEIFTLLVVVSLVSAHDLELTCPQVEYPPLPEGTFMEQREFDCHDNLFGKIYYTCYYGTWVIMEECRCRYEKDSYGYRWWGVKVNKTEMITTPSGVLKRFCEASGWGNYDGSKASSCKTFGLFPETPRGDSINMCSGEGTHIVRCDFSGKWVEEETQCYCPAEDGWERALEGTVQERACGTNKEFRVCGAHGVWGSIDQSQCMCAPTEHFPATHYNTTSSAAYCDNGVAVTKLCTTEGIWTGASYSDLCKCNEASGDTVGLVGDERYHACSYGAVAKVCNEVGHWEFTQNDCACAATGIWAQAELGTVAEVVCSNGGRLRRACADSGFWEDVQDFNCRCPAEGIWGETEAGEYARAGCGNGFVRRLCGPDGVWTEEYDRSACYCAPQSGWLLTLSGSVASKVCAVGEMTRSCNEWGTWSEIDYSECMCGAVDGFEATPVNTLASAPCFDADGVVDPVNVQTRFCGSDGVWGELDQTQCPVKWCPTVQSWYKVPVSTHPTTVTIGCMSGSRSRVCNIDGTWGPVDVTNCKCAYTPEGALEETLLSPGDSYSLTCSSGYRVITCNSDSGYFDAADLTNCKCAADMQFPDTLAGSLASAGCDFGTATRVCNLEGQWETRDISNCYCGGDDVWTQSAPGNSVSVLCDQGFRMRQCDDYGFWGTPQGTCKCVAEGREAVMGESLSDTCEEGAITRLCKENGHFAEADASTCFCNSRYEFGLVWNRIPTENTAPAMTCMNGASVTRHCTEGHWEELDSTACRCLAEDVWAETGVGEVATAACEGHSSGVRTRECHGHQWGPVDDSQCVEACEYHHGSGNVTYVAVGDYLEVPCYVNLDGFMNYTCQRDTVTGQSILNLVESTCTRLACTTDDGKLINVGETEYTPCGAGLGGSRKRVCLPGALWSELDYSECSPLRCEATTIPRYTFPHVQGAIDLINLVFVTVIANTASETTCPSGYNGMLRLNCGIDGKWATTITNDCVLNKCPAEGEWPETPAYSSHTIPCPSDYTGTWSRQCLADGVWEEAVIPASCVPIPPTYKTMPYNGMTHVSRAPSAALLSTLAIKAPYEGCTVSVVSTSDATEQYELRVNATKSAVIGRHRNGGVFADFALPESADVHDMSNYLRYGEYKMTFPACWSALNGATVPEAPVEVTFTTAPVPPSAPANVELEFAGESFSVKFETPLVVDAAYPITAYYLAFQPPVLPEVRIDASVHTFGPFAYMPGRVTLLLRAENAFGLSSPDVEATYDFDEVLLDAADHLRIESAAPQLTVVSQAQRDGAVAVTIAVAAPIELQALSAYLEITCNGESVTAPAGLAIPQYVTLADANSDLTVTCFFTLGETAGLPATLTVPVAVPVKPYGAVEVAAEETVAGTIRLSWTQAATFSSTAVRAYAVQCGRQGEVATAPVRMVTALETELSVAEWAPAVECRVAASATMFAPEDWRAVWTTTTMTVHSVTAAELSVAVEVYARYLKVAMTSPYCVAASAEVRREGHVAAVADLVCGENSVTADLVALEPETAYDVIVRVPALNFEHTVSATTTATVSETLEVTLVEGSVTGVSAVVRVVSSTPDIVDCVAAPTPVSPAQLLQEALAGRLSAESKPAFTHTIYLNNLEPRTVQAVTCVARASQISVVAPDMFTTAAARSPLIIREVEVESPVPRAPVFVFHFDGAVRVSADAALWVSCGGRSQNVGIPTTAVEGADHDRIRVELGLLPAGAACSLGFASLDAVQRIPAYDMRDVLSATPFSGAARYDFVVVNDALAPKVTMGTEVVLDAEMAVLGAVSESLKQLMAFEYRVECTQDNEPTVSRAFSAVDYPLVMQNGVIAVHTGLLPHLHDCAIRIPVQAVGDAARNTLECTAEEGDCVFRFISRVAAPEQMTLDLVSVTPADEAAFVAVNAPIVMTFNRDVVATKAVSLRCMDCETPVVVVEAVCSATRCVIEKADNWEANTTYYLTYDGTTFRAAWETFFLAVPERFTSFTTAANACSMEFIAAEWDTSCSCINTGTHCQCNCGATAILKAF